MDHLDAKKIAFQTPKSNFHYTVMPFGLKNASSTYQRTMTAIFHDMLHDCLEDFVYDIVVKSMEKHYHVKDLRNFFDRCRQYNLWMNPLICAFCVSSGIFLRFTIHKKGIALDPMKTKSMQDIGPPTTCRRLESFMGRVSYVHRFILAWQNSSNHSSSSSKECAIQMS